LEGERRRELSEVERVRLRRAIALVDARLPGGGNCYRRSLLQIALDPEAAREPFFMGLHAAGGDRSGHAWVGEAADGRSYDAVIRL
jgi:hypothetical protein